MKMSYHGSFLGAVCAFSLAFAHQGIAATVEGFEPGDPPVTTSGDASTKQTYQGVVPPQGSNQFLITTINTAGVDGTDGYSNQSGTNAVSNSTLQTFFGVSGLVGTEGSGFKLSIIVPPGSDTITFQYDFLTNELPSGGGVVQHQDIAFAVLLNSANALVGTVRTVATPGSVDFNNPARQLTPGPIATNPFSFDSGYGTFTISGLAAGTYTLGIGVEDRTTSDTPSGLLVDNIQVSSSVVPEPSTVGLMIAGAASLVAARRRFKKSGR
jgi:hypothetical protein